MIRENLCQASPVLLLYIISDGLLLRGAGWNISCSCILRAPLVMHN